MLPRRRQSKKLQNLPRPLGLEALETRLAMAGMVGTVGIEADITINRPGQPNVNGDAFFAAELTFLDAGNFTKQSIIDETATAEGTITGKLNFSGFLLDVDGTFETDPLPPTVKFIYSAAPNLDIEAKQTGTFQAVVEGDNVTGTFLATINARANFDTLTISGSLKIDFEDDDGFQDTQTVNFVNQPLTITPNDFELPVGTLGSIGDRIWFDDNNNGIFDNNEDGVPGIGVTLFSTVDNDVGDGDDVAVETTQSNQDGFYSFINIPPGKYYVRFDPTVAGQEYTDKDVGADDTKDSDVDPDSRNTALITIGASSHFTNVDAGIRDLFRPWQNPNNRFDVSNGNGVNSLDVVLLLRDLKINGNRRLRPNVDPPPPPYYDINGDNKVTPQDVSQLVAKVIRPNGEGEGDSVIAAYDQLHASPDNSWLAGLNDLTATAGPGKPKRR